MLDVSLASATSRFDKVLVVLRRQMRRQQADRCQRQVARLEPFQQHGILAYDASRLDAAVCGVL
jgi:hypothetical protein